MNALAAIGAVGVGAAAMRWVARFAGVEADVVCAFLDGNGEVVTLDVEAFTKRRLGALGVEVGEAVDLLGVQGSRSGAGAAETVLARCYAVAHFIARAGVIIGSAPAVEWPRSDHTWLGGAPLEVLAWPGGEQRVFLVYWIRWRTATTCSAGSAREGGVELGRRAREAQAAPLDPPGD